MLTSKSIFITFYFNFFDDMDISGRLRLNVVSFVVLDEVDACLMNIETRNDLHKLLSRQLSSSYKTIDEGL